MPEIFINYRTGDGEQLAALFDEDLSRRFGSDKVFRASKSIRPGQNFRNKLASASAGTQVLLVVIGPRWLTIDDEYGTNPLKNEDNWTRKEIVNALACGAHIVPILCGRNTPQLYASQLPAELAPLTNFQAVRFDTGNTQADLAKLAAVLTELVPGLVDRATDHTKQEQPDPGHHGTYNSISGTVTGPAIQAGSIGQTAFNGPSGPVHSGNAQSRDVYNFAAPSSHVGIQGGSVTGSSVHMAAASQPPSGPDLASELAAVRDYLMHARSTGELDDATYEAAQYELDTASKAGEEDSSEGKRTSVLALKRLRGLIGDLGNLAAKIAPLIAAVNGNGVS